MSELPNYPFMDQLRQEDLDGLPDLNASQECVAVCIASSIKFLTGKDVSGEELLHAVYGPNYTGPTATGAYISYVRTKYGVQLTTIFGNTDYLVSQIHKNIQLGNPVLGYIPSSYAPPADPNDPGPSHCIAFYKEDPNLIGAMNPWHAFTQSGSDAWWSDRLCFGQVCIVTKETKKLQIPQGWKDDGKNKLVAPNGHDVVSGFREHVLSSGWHPDDLPLEEEHGDGSGGTEQLFRSRRLRWNPKQGVFEEYIGEELQKLIAQAQTTKQLSPDAMNALAHAMQILQPLANVYLDIQKAVNA